MNRAPGPLPWRVLLALSAVVIAVHLLVLQAPASRFAARAGQDAPQTFATRMLPADQGTQPEPKAPPAASAAPVLPKPQKYKPKVPGVPVQQAPAAIDSIADTRPPALTSELPSTLPAELPPQPSVASASSPTAVPAPASPVDTAAPLDSAPPPAASPPPLPATTQVTAVSLPASVRLKYSMTGESKGLTYHANAELNWSNNGSQYEAGMRVSALFLGSRSMASSGQITATGLSPSRFSDKSRSELAAHFLPDQGKIVFSANTPDAPWKEGVQDRVTLFFQLAGILAADPVKFPAGSSITLYTIGPRDADTWTFLVGAEEKLTLPGGEITVIKLSRKPRREFDTTVEIWYAPSLDWLPVRNRITQQNGDFVDQQLTSLVKP